MQYAIADSSALACSINTSQIHAQIFGQKKEHQRSIYYADGLVLYNQLQ